MRIVLAKMLLLFCIAALGQSPILEAPAQAQVFTKEKPKPAPRPERPRKPPPRAKTASAPEPMPKPVTFDDPVEYCAVNPSASGPGPDYTGGIPQWLVEGWKIATNNSRQTKLLATKWRCSGERVLACATPFDEDLCSLPERIEEPSAAMTEYCEQNRKGAIPREITGNTVPIWICKRKEAKIAGYRSDLDEAGYLSDTFIDVTEYSPAYMIGAVPRDYARNWQLPVKVGLLSRLQKSGAVTVVGQENPLITSFAAMNISGGPLNSVIGTTTYYGQNPAGQVGPTGCVGELILTEATATSITVVERHQPGSRNCRSPELLMLQEKDGQLLVNWMKKGRKKPERSEWVQAFQ
jgi:hypothetical protein